MKKLSIILFCFASTLAFSQDVDLKKGKILVDGKQWGTYEGCKMFDEDCSFNVGKEEIVVQHHTIQDASFISNTNRNGTKGWFEIKFLGKKKSFEMNDFPSKIAKVLYKGNVVDANGNFDDDAIDRLIEKYGFEYSDKYLNRPTNQTIIIEDSRPRNGVNISIGR